MDKQQILENPQTLASVFMLFLGIGMLFLGIIAGTTDLFKSIFGVGRVAVWELSGLLAGMGVPIGIFGVFNLLPATKKQRYGAIFGIFLSAIGIIIFITSYPNNWYGDPTDNTFLATGTYALGALLTVGFLFISVANADTRSGKVRRKPKSEQAQSVKSLFKELISVAGDHDNDGIDKEKIKEEISQESDSKIEDSKIEEGEIKILRDTEISHSEFVLSLPQYVNIKERENDYLYTVSIDEEIYYLSS